MAKVADGSGSGSRPRRWPWIVLGALGLLVLALALALPALLDVERHRDRLERALAEATGWEAELGELRLSVWRGMVLAVSPARLAAPGGDSSSFELESLEIRAALLPLFRGAVEIRSVELVRPVIRLVRRTEREGWVLPPLPLGEAGPPSVTAGQGSGVTIAIARIGVRHGAVRFEDRGAKPAWTTAISSVTFEYAPTSGELAGRGEIADAGGRIEVEGSLARGLRLRLDGLRSEFLHPFLGDAFIHGGGLLSADVRVTRPLAIEGRLRGTSLTLLSGTRPFATPVVAKFAVRSAGRGWNLERLAADAGGLRLTGGGPLVPALDLALELAPTSLDVALEAAPSVLPLPLRIEAPGTLDARLDIEQPPGGALVHAAVGSLSAARFFASDILPPLENVETTFELSRRGVLTVRLEQGTAAGGPVTGVARLSSIDPPGQLTFDGGLQEAVLGSLLAGFAGEQARKIAGATGVQANVGLDIGRPEIDARALSGRVSIGSKQVGLPGWDLERAIGKTIDEKLSGGGALAALLGQEPPESKSRVAAGRAQELAQRALESLEAQVDFDRFPWGLERLALVAGDLSATGNGTFDPIASVVRLKLAARLAPEKTKVLVAKTEVLQSLVDGQGRLTLPLEVEGALTAPSIRVDLSQALGSLEKEKKKEAVQRLVEGLFDRERD